MTPYTSRDIDELRGLDLSERERRLVATVDNLAARNVELLNLANLHLDIGARAAERARCVDCQRRVHLLAQARGGEHG